MRKAEFGYGWVQTKDGVWQALDKARFTADCNPVTNIDAGISTRSVSPPPNQRMQACPSWYNCNVSSDTKTDFPPQRSKHEKLMR